MPLKFDPENYLVFIDIKIFDILLTWNSEILRCRPLESLILVLKHTARFGFWFFLWSSQFFFKNERLGFTNSVIPKVDSHCGKTTNEVGFNQTKHLDFNFFQFGLPYTQIRSKNRLDSGTNIFYKNFRSVKAGKDK